MSSAAQNALTTLLWLEDKGHGSYVGNKGRPAIDRLEGALSRMSYGKAQYDVLPDSPGRVPYSALISRLARNWSESDHKDLVKFLSEGGYTAEVERLREKHEKKASKEAQRDPATVPHKAPMSPEAKARAEEEEIAALIEEKLLNEDPRLGAW